MKGYPALAAWRKRFGTLSRHRTYDNLWRAAMAEAEASECRDNAQREQLYQREAISILLGEPVHKVQLIRDTMRRYLVALETYEQKGAA